MSHKNKFRFLSCLLFSVVAHSGVLVASLFFQNQIVEDPQGSTIKQTSQVNASAAPSSPLQIIEFADAKVAPSNGVPTETPSEIKDAVQVAELTRSLPEKNSPPILMAKEDDPTALEIKKPVRSKAKVASEKAPEKIAEKETPKPKTKTQTKAPPKKIAKLAKPQSKKANEKKSVVKTKPEIENKKDDKTSDKFEDTIVASNAPTSQAELVPVKEQVDAQASEEPIANETEKAVAVEKIVEPVNEPVKEASHEAPVESQVATELAETESAKNQSGSGQNPSPAPTVNEGGGKSSDGTPGGAPTGIRDGDSLAEIPGNLRPLYPLEDRRAKREGTAVFIARVTPEGRVKDIKLENAATPSMNAAALKAFANYHYKIGQQGWIRKKFVFKITGEIEETAHLRRTSQIEKSYK